MCGYIPGRLDERCGGSIGRDRNAASMRLSRTVGMLLRRARRGERTLRGLARLRRSVWCFLMNAAC